MEDFTPFSERLDENSLAHYGKLGMKWGVRNEETLRKYAGAKGQKKTGFEKITAAASAGAVKTGRFAANKIKGVASKQLRKMRTDREVTRMMDAAGLKRKRQRKEFLRTRTKTLASHDPEVVFRGAYTLTDEELTEKLNRINRESQLLNVAVDRKTKASNAEQARQAAKQAAERAKQASVSGRIVDAAISTVSTTVSNAGREATKRVLDTYFPEDDKKKKSGKGVVDIEPLTSAVNNLTDTIKEEKSKKLGSDIKDSLAKSEKVIDDIASLRKSIPKVPDSDRTESLKNAGGSRNTMNALKDTPRYEYGTKWWERRKKSK